jgi:hypothetical protein
MPSSFPQFCFVFGLFNTFFSITEVIYLIYFLIHVILNVNKSIKESKNNEMQTNGSQENAGTSCQSFYLS